MADPPASPIARSLSPRDPPPGALSSFLSTPHPGEVTGLRSADPPPPLRRLCGASFCLPDKTMTVSMLFLQFPSSHVPGVIDAPRNPVSTSPVTGSSRAFSNKITGEQFPLNGKDHHTPESPQTLSQSSLWPFRHRPIGSCFCSLFFPTCLFRDLFLYAATFVLF